MRQRPDRGQHHREHVGRAAREDRVHRDDAPRDHARSGRQHRQLLVGIAVGALEHGVDPLRGGRDEGQAVAPAVLLEEREHRLRIGVGELQETIGVDGGHARCAGYRGWRRRPGGREPGPRRAKMVRPRREGRGSDDGGGRDPAAAAHVEPRAPHAVPRADGAGVLVRPGRQGRVADAADRGAVDAAGDEQQHHPHAARATARARPRVLRARAGAPAAPRAALLLLRSLLRRRRAALGGTQARPRLEGDLARRALLPSLLLRAGRVEPERHRERDGRRDAHAHADVLHRGRARHPHQGDRRLLPR